MRHIRAVDRPDAQDRCYLGDGLYAAYDGFGVWVTAEDGIRATDAVYFEPDVLGKLVSFYEGQQPPDHASAAGKNV